MADYKVTWTIDVDADSFEEAARQALEMQRDPGGTATVFAVTDGAGVTREVDLQGEQEGGGR